MRKTILGNLTRAFLRTFPPINKNGNNVIGDVKRVIITMLMHIVGGKNMEMLIREIVTEWENKQAV